LAQGSTAPALFLRETIMNIPLILAEAGGGLGDTMKGIGEQFGFQKQLFFSQVISFCVLAFLLQRFAYKPILNVLEDPRTRIAEGLANADKIKQELAAAQGKSQEIINAASVQGNKLIEEARQSAAKVLEAETQKAVATANDIIVKARQASEAE